MKDQYQFAINLRKILDSIEMSQKTLAKKTGIHERTISRILTNKNPPSFNTLVRILKVLPVKFERLVTYERL